MSQRRFPRKHLKDPQGHGILPNITPINVDYKGDRLGNYPKEDAFFESPNYTLPKLNCSMISKYESSVKRITWVANNSRRDLALAANSLAARAANPTQNGCKKLFHCLGYIS